MGIRRNPREQVSKISLNLYPLVILKMDSPGFDLTQLSPHLFWDVNHESVSWNTHKEFVVERILDYGLTEDWLLLRRHLGIAEIAEIASHSRNLSPRSLAFISALSKKPKEEFRCYTSLNDSLYK